MKGGIFPQFVPFKTLILSATLMSRCRRRRMRGSGRRERAPRLRQATTRHGPAEQICSPRKNVPLSVPLPVCVCVCVIEKKKSKKQIK